MRSVAAGDLVLVRFHPSFGRELKKYRPAIVVIPPELDERFVTVVPLTTSSKLVHLESEYTLEHPSLQQPSVVLSWYLMTIDVDRIEYPLGILKKKDARAVLKQCRQLFKP